MGQEQEKIQEEINPVQILAEERYRSRMEMLREGGSHSTTRDEKTIFIPLNPESVLTCVISAVSFAQKIGEFQGPKVGLERTAQACFAGILALEKTKKYQESPEIYSGWVAALLSTYLDLQTRIQTLPSESK